MHAWETPRTHVARRLAAASSPRCSRWPPATPSSPRPSRS